jgi:hypothetical protein
VFKAWTTDGGDLFSMPIPLAVCLAFSLYLARKMLSRLQGVDKPQTKNQEMISVRGKK